MNNTPITPQGLSLKRVAYRFTNGIGLLLIALLFNRCSQNPLDVDISDVKTPGIELLRLENDLFALNQQNIDTKTAELKQKYGVFYDHYLMNFIARQGTADSLYKSSVLNFVSDKNVRDCYNMVRFTYPDSKIKALTEPLNDCVKRFHYHFPARKLPSKLVTCTTGWNYAFAYFDSSFVIGLDMYLGDTSIFYGMLRYPLYQVRKMNEHYLLPDIARGWLLTEFDNQESENILINHCIFYGKLYYAVNALLPNTPDSLIIGYNSKQMQYCKTYEKNLWSFFAEKNRLYENNMNTIRELTSEGPFSGAISKECPPRIAMWVGWQIVKSYMKNNPEVSLNQLMDDRDAQKILNKSKYRP